MLYRVRIGEDDYLGRAAEVVAFMARAEGAPGHDNRTYMEGVAARVREALGIESVDPSDEEAFLDSLAASGVVPVETIPEPSADRVDPDHALGQGWVSLGDGVDPHDVKEL